MDGLTKKKKWLRAAMWREPVICTAVIEKTVDKGMKESGILGPQEPVKKRSQ